MATAGDGRLLRQGRKRADLLVEAQIVAMVPDLGDPPGHDPDDVAARQRAAIAANPAGPIGTGPDGS
jgi:hypothetical protein